MDLLKKFFFNNVSKLNQPSWTAVLLLALLAVYTIAMLSVIQWGIPGITIAYPYHMDEWHQFMAVTSLVKHFTNNIPGASRGPLFFYLLTNLYLGPFVLLHIIHPSLLAHHFTSAGLTELHRIFILLRLNTLVLGNLTLILIYIICKRQLFTNPLLAVLLFGSTPLWITWSNYFKYDLAVAFWIVFSIYCLFRYKSNPTNTRFYLSGIVVALTIATKISATPLAALYFFAFFLFTPKPLKHIARLFIGLVVLSLVFALFGIPDILFLGKNWGDYVTVDLVNRRSSIFGMPWYLFLLKEHYPIIFGHGLYFLMVVSGVYYVLKIRKVLKKTSFKKYNNIVFLAVGLLLFCASLVSLEAGAVSERMFVILPFVVLLVTTAITKLLPKNKLLFIPLLCFIIAIQLFESYTWVSIKLTSDPRVTSSSWIVQHIKPGTKIALENPPIYQGIPNILLLDYYRQQSQTIRGIYNYEIINKSAVTSPYVIVTNADYVLQFDPSSSKRIWLAQLKHNGYRRLALFIPDLSLYSYFGDERNLYFSGLLPLNSIEVYAKAH